MNRFRQLLPILFFILLTGCKKESRSAEEWEGLALAKFSEIEALVATVPCSRQSEATVEAVNKICGQLFFPVVPSINAKFERLRREYEYLYGKMWQTFHEEGGVIDCFEPSPRAIRIGCENNKLLVYTVRNLPLDEARAMATDLYGKILHYRDTVTCQGDAGWGFTTIPNAAAEAWITVPVAMGPGWFDKTVSLSEYRTLANRIMEADGKVYLQRTDYPQRVICQNGKPVVEDEGAP